MSMNYATLLEEARSSERNGQLTTAAEWFATAAMKGLIEADFQQSRSLRIIYSTKLRSVSCDVRAGNLARARQLWDLLEPAFEPLFVTGENNYMPYVGMAYEIRGDAHLMLGRPNATRNYKTAQQLYSQFIEDYRDNLWGAEEEYHGAHGAFRPFLQALGESLPDDHYANFDRRLDYKLDLATRLYPQYERPDDE